MESTVKDHQSSAQENSQEKSLKDRKKLYSWPCSHITKNKGHLNIRIRTNTGERPVKCPHPGCLYATARNHNLDKHQLVHTKQKNFECPTCHKKSGRKSDLNKHLMVHENVKPYPCPLCPYKCKWKGGVKKHLVHVHSTEKPFHCQICKFKTKAKSDLNRHMKRHTGQKPHACPHCPYKSFTSDQLKCHLIVHTGERPFVCQFCDYTASAFGQLNWHMAVHHTKEKYFNCKWCDFSCVSSGRLVRHMRKHTGEKPYKCPQCKFSFSQVASLSNHTKSRHSEGRLLKCESCSYTTRVNLSRHVRRHHGPKISFANLTLMPNHREPAEEALDVGHSCKFEGCQFSTVDGTELALHHSNQHNIPIILLRPLHLN